MRMKVQYICFSLTSIRLQTQKHKHVLTSYFVSTGSKLSSHVLAIRVVVAAAPCFHPNFLGARYQTTKIIINWSFVILIVTIFAKNILNAPIFNANVICVFFFMVNYNQLNVYYCKRELT